MKWMRRRLCRARRICTVHGNAVRLSCLGCLLTPFPLAQEQVHQDLVESTTIVFALAFSPDGQYLVGGSCFGRLVVWDVRAALVCRDCSRCFAIDWHAGLELTLPAAKRVHMGATLFTDFVLAAHGRAKMRSAAESGASPWSGYKSARMLCTASDSTRTFSYGMCWSLAGPSSPSSFPARIIEWSRFISPPCNTAAAFRCAATGVVDRCG